MAAEEQVDLTGRNTALDRLVTLAWRLRNQPDDISCFQRGRVFGRYDIQVRPDELLPGRRGTPLRGWRDVVPAQDITHSLVRNLIAEIGQRTHDAVISPAPVLPCQPDYPRLHFGRDPWAAGIGTTAGASNFCATSRRYQARRVSGLATRATSCRALRPRRLATSARVDRSASDSRSRAGGCARRMRFSATRYSFRSNNS